MDSISARCWSLSQGGSTALYGHSAKYRVSGYFQRKWKSISVTFSIVFINHETLDLLRVRPEIALDASGKPLISPEILGAFDPTPDAPRASTAAVRAIKDVGYEVHNKIQVIEGRRLERGKNEWMVGQRLLVRFPILHVGAKARLGRLKVDFPIVGVFSDDGSARAVVTRIGTQYDSAAAPAWFADLQ